MSHLIQYSLILFLFLQARALTAHMAETESIQFFVGTQSLRCDNQVRTQLWYFHLQFLVFLVSIFVQHTGTLV